MLHPAIFLDRDGVIIENRADHVKSIAAVQFIPGALAALAALAASDRRVVIVTNQAVVGRGLITLAEAEAINHYVRRQIETAGGRVDGLYLCPHHPDEGCACRKPRPGMLLAAAQALEIDLAQSVLIGDALTDVQAAQAAGAQALLVRTGRGAAQTQALAAAGLAGVPVFEHLAEALQSLQLKPAQR